MIDVENQNVLLIQIVLLHLLVEMRNVLIPVIVHEMLIAHREITEEYVIVVLGSQATHMALLALQVRS